jgi:hypothetical protein
VASFQVNADWKGYLATSVFVKWGGFSRDSFWRSRATLVIILLASRKEGFALGSLRNHPGYRQEFFAFEVCLIIGVSGNALLRESVLTYKCAAPSGWAAKWPVRASNSPGAFL